MAFVKINIHCVWSTKNRAPLLDSPALRKQVWGHIYENAKNKNIHIVAVNGYQDHCHCLLTLGTNQSIAEIIQLIKGESSFWINKNKLTKAYFNWQSEYFAVSVSESLVERVKDYLKNQEEHHAKKTFLQEFEEFSKRYGF